ncbi:MAG: UDP-N-acetylmuramoyl-L-alanyl-D-glutamate--2,6-diaminopimelate ligase [Patescibacteria group bacterium]|nr:UDP-N-acetylmuramoyl-L-alanyl-D-glutamate--2,6-diaminopimelate ligase [Patescibacteria group bacterium]
MLEFIKKPLRPLFHKITPFYNLYHHSLGILAATSFGFPSMKMRVIGITGTNGKTTTANLLAHILKSKGEKVGLATTVNVWDGSKKWTNETKMTTISPFALQGLLRRMVKNKCTYAIVETTSHSLAQHRTWGIFYDIALFTNLTHDHLDYHKTFERYKEAKGLLFKNLADSLRKPKMPKMAIVNISDPNSDYFKSFTADKQYFFGIDNLTTEVAPDTLVSAKNIRPAKDHTYFTLVTPQGSIDIKLKLPGKFNVYNALAAASTAYSLEIPLPTIQQGIESMWNLPGRMETVPNTKDFDIIIDYAHTPDGFEQVFKELRKIANNKIISVFGATGNRDKSKRPILGEIASKYADVIILTEEDHGTESPEEIIKEILPGIDQDKFKKDQNLFIIPDRKEALKKALQTATSGDLVLSLALGGQTVIVRGDKKIPFDERKVIEELLKTMA